jgi:hypothetical protein
MNATTYSFTTPRPVRMGPPPAPVTSPLCVFSLVYNGLPVLDFDGELAVFGSIWAACERIDQLAAAFGTSVGCFRVDRIWL